MFRSKKNIAIKLQIVLLKGYLSVLVCGEWCHCCPHKSFVDSVTVRTRTAGERGVPTASPSVPVCRLAVCCHIFRQKQMTDGQVYLKIGF